MPGTTVKHFNLPWHQHDHYWIGVYPRVGELSSGASETLQQIGLEAFSGQGLVLQAPRDWKAAWEKVDAAIAPFQSDVDVSIAIGTPGQGTAERKTPAALRALADSLWLGDALLEGRIMCYLQPVVSGPNKVFGYESFARVKMPDGAIIAGDRIIAASRVLGIEHMVDRHLHVQAIRTFVSSEFHGFLFVNFFPGFIHRPAVYLEGLSDTARSFGVVAKHLVLDFTKSETPRDLAHLRSVCEYGRSQGYSIALDDIESLAGAKKLVADIRPDFVKIDMQLARRAAEPEACNTIRDIVELTHSSGCAVIGEGVETEDMFHQLQALGVDLFQGYFFSPPMPVEAALKKNVG